MTNRQQTKVLAAIAIVISGLLVTWRGRRRGQAIHRHRKLASHCVSDPCHDDALLAKPISKIYLFAFPSVPHVHNISPFSLKVESFLRVYKIPYEMVPTFTFSSKGQIPYIRLNSRHGEEIPDSNVIVGFLRKKYAIDRKEDTLISAEEQAVAHAASRMVEEHTTQIGFYYRYGLHMHEFNEAVIPSDWFRSGGLRSIKKWVISKAWMYMMQCAFQKKQKWVPYGRHSDEEQWDFSCDDIQSLSDYLGDKKYFFGDEATTIDCTLFGHLAQFLYIPLDFPQKHYMHNHCSNLVQYVERFKEQYWDDWDEVLKKQD